MNFLKNKLKTFILFIVIFSITTTIYTLLLYFNIISNNNNAIKISTFIIGLILFFILGILSSVKENKNGWLSGLTSGLFIIVLIFLVNLLTRSFETSKIIKYVAYLFSSSLGGVIGINLKSRK